MENLGIYRNRNTTELLSMSKNSLKKMKELKSDRLDKKINSMSRELMKRQLTEKQSKKYEKFLHEYYMQKFKL